MQVKLEGKVINANDIQGWAAAQKSLSQLSLYDQEQYKLAAENAQFHVYIVLMKTGKLAYVIEQA